MPELPDLQVFSRNLTKRYGGKTLQTLNVYRDKKLNVPASELKQALEGAKLTEVTRDGKELFFHFDNGNVLSLHLMLHGNMVPMEEDPKEKLKIIEFLFEGATGFAVTDYMKQATPKLNPPPQKGLDALSKKLTTDWLAQQLGKAKTTAIKTFLIDQKKLKGIGNAYADEILWEARISPFSQSGEIPADKVRDLVAAIRKVLKDAEKHILKHHPGLITGEVRAFLKIHHPKIEQSPTGGTIKTAEIGGRKTYFTDEQIIYKS